MGSVKLFHLHLRGTYILLISNPPATMRTAAVFLLVIGLTLGKKVTIDWNPSGKEITKCVDVGDEVEFTWDGDTHNLIQVSSKADYDACKVGENEKKGKKGPAEIKVKEKGDLYFVCGVDKHCEDLKQKAKISTDC